MSADKHNAASGAQVERGVRPVAEIVGGVLRWHIPEPYYALAQHFLRGVHLLYDQAALDGARQAIYEAEAAQLTAPLRAKIAELEAAEEGAKLAFGHVVAQKRAAERECTHLQGLLDDAHAQIRRQAALIGSRV